MKIKFFSRHDARNEIKEAINSSLEHMGITTHEKSFQLEGENFERGYTWSDAQIIQDSKPFSSGLEIIERAIDSLDIAPNEYGDIEVDTLVIAGVFPADIIGRIIEVVQGEYSPCTNLKIITFKYERDREANTVSHLTHTIVWEVSPNKLTMNQVKVGGQA